ncbi:KilA-N domain-containing protein [Comamonas thiooxydans]|uniref:KilA-N domain-containing protein n=1 Tax=Comamonas thiooxydans TaxID=363952 RepID=UPI00070FA74B|nr:KilA-N domain-containing protein [Comamonas thiooxydans]
MNAVIIFSTDIRQDSEGRFCLNDLHRAAGGENRHRPSLWVENQQTRALTQELSKAGFPALLSTKGGRTPGVFAVRELVIAYAAWISPAFHVKVLQVFLAATAPNQPLLQRAAPSYMREAWFAILRHQAGCTMHRALARALQIHESTLSQVLNGSGYYGAGRCSTDRIARRVMRVFCAKQRIHPRQLSLV